jgi:hypothetical protein
MSLPTILYQSNMIHGVIFQHKSLAGNFPVLMEAMEFEFNFTTPLGLKTTGFGRPTLCF